MRFTEKSPLVIGEPGGKVQHVVSTGTAIGYDIDLHEEAFITGKGAQDEIKRGLFILVDDADDSERTAPATVGQVTFDTPGRSADVAPPVVAANPNLAGDPTEGGDKRARARQAEARRAAGESRTDTGQARTVEQPVNTGVPGSARAAD